MEKLLHWSIAQQEGDEEAIKKVGAPDPKALNQLLGGPDEATLMRDSIAAVQNPELDVDTKIVALENFEMLIENLDNANNIENLKLWSPLIETLGDKEFDDEIKVLILSIIGIAVQNNTKSQSDFTSHEKGLELLMKMAKTTENETLRLKALFALSSLVRDYNPAFVKFEKLNGLDLLKISSSSDSSKYNLRILSLLSSILSNGLNDNTKKYLQENHLISQLSSLLVQVSSPNLIDKALNILSNLHRLGYEFSSEEKGKIDEGIKAIEEMSDKLNKDDYHAAKKVVG